MFRGGDSWSKALEERLRTCPFCSVAGPSRTSCAVLPSSPACVALVSAFAARLGASAGGKAGRLGMPPDARTRGEEGLCGSTHQLQAHVVERLALPCRVDPHHLAAQSEGRQLLARLD